MKCWKLHPGTSINYAELYAIYQALIYIKNQNLQQGDRFCIMTESMVSLLLIKSSFPARNKQKSLTFIVCC